MRVTDTDSKHPPGRASLQAHSRHGCGRVSEGRVFTQGFTQVEELQLQTKRVLLV